MFSVAHTYPCICACILVYQEPNELTCLREHIHHCSDPCLHGELLTGGILSSLHLKEMIVRLSTISIFPTFYIPCNKIKNEHKNP